jgi:hypothetical protein
VTRFINHLELATTNNYNTIADSTLYIPLHSTSSSACRVSIRCFLVTNCNTGDSSPSRTEVTSSETPVQNYQLTKLKVKVKKSQAKSQSDVTTDCQSASLSWNKAPIWSLTPDIYYCLTVIGFLMCRGLSDERTGLSFARVTVSSSKSFVSMYNLHFTCY